MVGIIAIVVYPVPGNNMLHARSSVVDDDFRALCGRHHSLSIEQLTEDVFISDLVEHRSGQLR